LNAESHVRENCLLLVERIKAAAARSGRSPESIRLLAVTKTVPPERIREAIESGIVDIGENRLQEALAKQEAVTDSRLVWHFIGRIQSNKAKKIAQSFAWVHSIDRQDVAEKLNAGLAGAQRRLQALIEVNLGGESAKGGVKVDELAKLTAFVRDCPQLDLRGLMTVPPQSGDAEAARPYFRQLKKLANDEGLVELSMGMSHDFETAIEEGATIVRIGTALFGPRQ
jgi:pyridoxal phosphate enzyme (YggS family)